MNIEIEHHYGWSQHPVPDGTSMHETAYAAVRATHNFLTSQNHRHEYRDTDDRGGRVVVVRQHDTELLADPGLRRLAEAFGNKAGDLWFGTRWRRAYEHATLAVDDLGRRWAHVRLSSGYGKWECVSDLLMLPWEIPGPSTGRSCCGSGDLKGKVCDRHGGPWHIGGQATDLELRLADAVRLRRHDLYLLVEVEAGRRTHTQAAHAARCGKAQQGRDRFVCRTRRILMGLLEAHQDPRVVEVPGYAFDTARRLTLSLAGIYDAKTARLG